MPQYIILTAKLWLGTSLEAEMNLPLSSNNLAKARAPWIAIKRVEWLSRCCIQYRAANDNSKPMTGIPVPKHGFTWIENHAPDDKVISLRYDL
jgi:hypothetical protein